MKGIIQISLSFLLIIPSGNCRNIIIIFLFLADSIVAQQVNLKLYTSARGYVYEDSNGYLWTSSVNGINRFDGRQFVNFDLKDGLPSLFAWVNLEDSHHRLWASTYKGMARFIGNKFVTYPLSDSLKIGYNFRIIETSKKQIWALTDKGVYQFNDTIWQKIKLFPGYENMGCRGIIETDSGIYINYGSLLVCNDWFGKWQVIKEYEDPHGPYFNELMRHGKTLLISTRNAIYKIEHKKLIPLLTGLKGVGYFTYFIDSKDRLWYYFAEDKAFHISAPGNWQQFTQEIPNPYGQAIFINEDTHGNIWIGTQEGLLKIQQAAFSTIAETESSQIGGATNGFALVDSSLLLSSLYGLLFYSPNNPAGNYISINKKETIIDSWCRDEKKQTWFITRNNQLYLLTGKKFTNFSFLLSSLHAGVMYDCSYDEKKKRLFIVCDKQLIVGNEKKMEIFTPTNKNIRVPLFSRVLATRNGEIFLTQRGGSIYMIDENDSLFEWKEDNDLTRDNITMLYETPNGDIWVNDQRTGLMQYRFNRYGKPELIKIISEEEGLQNQNILSMAFDSLQRIWITTPVGLDILQKNNKGEWEIFNYSQDAEIQVNWGQARLITDAKGDVWLTSWHKLVRFDCHQLKLEKEIPKVIIENVQLNLHDVDWSKYTDSLFGYQQLPVRPRLNYKKNTISFFFNGLSFSSSPRLEYSYQLSPVDESWSLPASNASISFVNLSPGKYIFKVKTRDQGSAWSIPAEFSFTIIAPFWMKWWFFTLCGIVTFAIIYSIYKYRINQVKKILTIRTKISRDLHDEVGSTLTSINILSKVSRSNLEKDRSRVSDMLQKITEQSANMQQSMSDIVWSIRPDNDKWENLVIRMREYLGQTAEPKNLLVEFYADEKVLKESVTMAQRQNIFLIYKEAVNNAVKYSQGKKISVFLGKENNHIKLSIEDDGMGFDPGRITSSSGLKNMQDRAKELKGDLNIYSSLQTGTKVELRCPAT